MAMPLPQWMLFPCNAIGNYVTFVRLACRTPWNLTNSQGLLSEDGGLDGVGTLTPLWDCWHCHVFVVVFGSAFLQYLVRASTGDMLKYVVLINSMGASTLLIGMLDSMQSVADILLNFAGYAHLTQLLLSRSPRLCLNIGAALFTCGAAGISFSASLGAGVCAFSIYFVASYLLSLGLGMFWTVWAPRLRREGCKAMQSVWGNELDMSAKMAQMQVVTRYPSGALAPILVTSLLGVGGRDGQIGLAFAYGACVVLFWLLCCASGVMVESNPKRQSGAGRAGQDGQNATSLGTPPPRSVPSLSWFDVLPSWCGHLAAKCGLCNLCPQARGQLSRQYLELGLFLSMTEAVRGGYARVIALKALTTGMSPHELALVLAVVFWTATSTFWLSDIADSGRRRASVLSFALLGAGHAGLGLSTSLHGVLASAVLFGIGEGMSTGLRALVQSDYSIDDRGILALKRDRAERSESGFFGENQRNMFASFCNVWKDATSVLNALVFSATSLA